MSELTLTSKFNIASVYAPKTRVVCMCVSAVGHVCVLSGFL